MSKKDEAKQIYEKLVSDYIGSRTNAGVYLLKMAQTVAEAKHNLSRKLFKKFLKDPRINIQRLQANKMIAVYQLSKSDSRLTHFINNEGIEKSYLLTVIKDETAREKFTEAIIDVPFTVKQTKQAVHKINNENKTPAQAVQEVRNKIGLPQPKPKEQSKTVPLADYNKLKEENEKLRLALAKYQQKPESLKPEELQEDEILQEPVKSDLPDDTVNPKRKSIIYKGYELPIPPAFNPNDENVNKIRQAAVNFAKNKHNLDLTV